MVNFFMFVSETPNKSRAFGFAATKLRSTFVTRIASGELASNFCKSFSFARSASRNLRGLSAAVLPSLVRVFCASRRYTVTCSDALESCDLNLVILPFVATIASREPASNFRKSFSFARSASHNLRGLSAAVLPSLVRVFCASRRYTVTCSDALESCDLNLVISIARADEIRSESRKSSIQSSLRRVTRD
jgi:hypothetical protein